ncbi:universal stress protein [Natronococcus wangiae]|uniref:universal stress protein n=1 Tax=Natronococcus wangiae TaxID=3068275 RepID=UPI00273F17C6|nr:universal stress protein [Natronococcus sp. AD5]
MTLHVLVPLDGSTQPWPAFDHAISTYEGETIRALNVVDPIEDVFSDYDTSYYQADAHDRAVERGKRLGEQAHERASNADIAQTTAIETTVETGRPARTITEYAVSNDVDHIVMGSHGRSGVSRILLGSVAETVARRVPVPVTIVR